MSPSRSEDELIALAWQAREQALAVHSGFPVGAALEAADGRVYLGCNIESSSYGLTCCAERVALFKALSEGVRQFQRIAVVTGARRICPPCGACRQLLADYAPELTVLLANHGGKQVLPFAELFPHGFNQAFLDER
jgi:cytidine deaminase